MFPATKFGRAHNIDNAKCAITKACIYEPEVQRSYAECAEGYPSHYRTAFASSSFLFPHRHKQTLRYAVPKGSDTGFPRSACKSASG